MGALPWIAERSEWRSSSFRAAQPFANLEHSPISKRYGERRERGHDKRHKHIHTGPDEAGCQDRYRQGDPHDDADNGRRFNKAVPQPLSSLRISKHKNEKLDNADSDCHQHEFNGER
jgi:hypothetical protein